MSRISRRDFLKLSAVALGGAALSSVRPLADRIRRANGSAKPNFIVLLLDAMSARNLSLYGYVRATTPNLERLAARATVYHSHYSGGNFTTTGTASTLLGLYPWTHRALDFRGLTERSLTDQNIFGLLGGDYYRLGYTQNPLANLLLGQFSGNLDEHLSARAFSFQQNMPMPEESFPRDYSTAYYAFGDFLGASEFNLNPASISLGYFDVLRMAQTSINSAPEYPLGYPSTYYTYFKIEEVMAGIVESLSGLAKTNAPFLAYYHLLPPHTPYTPKRDFLDLFLKDGLEFPVKPRHPLSETRKAQNKLARLRLVYDAYIADLDHEIGVFLKALEEAGLLDSNYLIVTSDHGELFERAEHGHGTPLLYEPVIKIPLLICAPGQTERKDVYSTTSNVDLLPTVLSLAGREIPARIEGRLLPGFGGTEDSNRSVFTVFAKENSSFLPLTKSVVSMVKGANKLIYYRGYPGYDGRFELYNLQDDPEELKDLILEDSATAGRMKEELLDAAHAADLPFQPRR